MKKLLKPHSLKAFLCHSHVDCDAVHALYKRLERDHMEPWLDRESLLPGQNWEHEIHRAILKSDVVLICLSNAFNEKYGFRHEELKIALKKTKILSVNDIFIIPVRLEKCEMPASLSHLHRVDLFEKDGYRRLIYSLQRLVEPAS